MSAIVDFYRNGIPRADGLTLAAVMAWSDQELERSRGVYGWLFPLDREEPDEPRTPLLTGDEVALFATDPGLRGAIVRARDFKWKSGWLCPALTEINATHSRCIGDAPMRFWRSAMAGAAGQGGQGPVG